MRLFITSGTLFKFRFSSDFVQSKRNIEPKFVSALYNYRILLISNIDYIYSDILDNLNVEATKADNDKANDDSAKAVEPRIR